LLKDIDKYLCFDPERVRIIVTKNIPEDSWTPISQNFELKVFENLEPRGFGANHNAALKGSCSDLLLICNPDIRLTHPISPHDFVTIYEKNGIFSAHIVNSEEKKQDYFRPEITVRSLLSRYLLQPTTDPKDWLAGMFLLINSNTFSALNGFDESFFMYVEDCDLSLRAKAKGWKTGVLKNIVVIHDAQRGSRRNAQHMRWHLSSLLYYFYKRIVLKAYKTTN
jgi:N-acetylglucosaminyl-diphospho-decaprenol L-rhamnosyltransferase